MSLRSALVDRAHTWERAASATEDEYGEPTYSDASGPQFRCRVSKPDPQEIKTDQIEFTQYVRDLSLICAMKAEDGTLIDIEANDRIVVEAGLFAGTYDVIGKPVPIRKKRVQIGWTMALKEMTGKEV